MTYVSQLRRDSSSLQELLMSRSRSFEQQCQAFDDGISTIDGESSRYSVDSNTWTASTAASPRLRHASKIDKPHFEEYVSGSDYSPSIASVRQAVVRTRRKSVEATIQIVTSPIFSSHGHFEDMDSAQSSMKIDHVDNATSTVPTQQPIRYRHSANASLSSTGSFNSNGDDELTTSQWGSLLPGPTNGQRMQSFLAPKARILSPAPWDENESTNNTSSVVPAHSKTNSLTARLRRNSSPIPESPERKKSNGKRPPFGVVSANRQKSSKSSRESASKSKDDPILLMKRKNSMTSLDSLATNTKFPFDDMPPLPANKLSASMPNSDSGNSIASHLTRSSQSMASIASTDLTSPSVTSKPPIPAGPIEQIKGKTQSNFPRMLISLSAAKEREKEKALQALPVEQIYIPGGSGSDSAGVKERSLKAKRSGFLKMFAKKEDVTSAPPLPLPPSPTPSLSLRVEVTPLPSPHPSKLLPKPAAQGMSIRIPPTGPLPQNQAIQQPKSAPPRTTTSQTTYLSMPPAICTPQNVKQAAIGLYSKPAPSLNLRPVSMAFSETFSKEMLLAQGSASRSNHLTPPHGLLSPMVSPTDSYFETPSDTTTSLTTPTTPTFSLKSPSSPISPASEFLSPTSARASPISNGTEANRGRIWELEQQVQRLEDELLKLRKEKDSLLAKTNYTKSCDACGCGTIVSSSVISRPRPVQVAEATLFSSKS